MNKHDPLLEPFRLKSLTLRNRIMSTSHAPNYVDDGNPGERYRLYHREKARGGLALTMFGGSSNVAEDSPSVFGQINAGRDEVIPYFQALAEAVHAEGAAIMCQLTHMGRRTVWNHGDWLPVIAPSRVREPAHRAFPKEMDAYDIARLVAAYGAAARRCKEGGLDGMELLAHGHLLEQFWSPRTNQRTDAYGGSRENRLRFTFEVLDEVRRQVGPDFIVGIRVGSESTMEGDLDLDENLAIAAALERSGLVDFFNVNRGHIESDQGLAHMMPGMADPLAPHLAVVGAFKREMTLPVFHACRVNDLATARHGVESGLVDMVGMTRAHIADPHLARKLMAGEEARIRPCVGAAYCIDRIYEGGEALCLHNAATGREATMPHVIAEAEGPRKTVVVVGGGPAGLEAARVSAERGHRVVLFEAAKDVGGQVALAAKAGWRRDLGGIVSWYADELAFLGVDVQTNRFADDADVLAESPDVVVVASGGLPDPVVTEGEELVTSTWDVLSGSASLAGDVLVFDDLGQHQAPSTAEYLAERGCKVELATADRMVAAEMGNLNYPIYMEHLYRLGVTMTPDRLLQGVRRQGNKLEVTLANNFTGATETRQVDHLVVEHGCLPEATVFEALKSRAVNRGVTDYEALLAGKPQPWQSPKLSEALAPPEAGEAPEPEKAFQLFRIGDAVSSRNIHAAIYDALRLCKDI